MTMAGIPSDLGSKLQAPQFGDVRDQLMQQFGPQQPDPNDQDEAVLSQLVADAHKLAAELTHYAVMEKQEDQTEQGAPPVGGPPMPPGVGGGPQGM